MTVAKDASMTGGNSADGLNQEVVGASAISSTGITVGPSATCLVAVLTFGGATSAAPTGVSLTWNSVPMTIRASVDSPGGGTSPNASSYIATLVNPASGAKTLAASWTGAQDAYMSAISFTGTDTVTGVNVADNITATQATSLAVNSSSDGATVVNFACDGGTPTVNFNKIYAEAPDNPGGGASYQLGGASNAHTFTAAGGTRQALAGVHVIAAAGGAVAPIGGFIAPQLLW